MTRHAIDPAAVTAATLIDAGNIKESHEEALKTLEEAQHIAHLGSWELDLRTRALSWSDEVFNIFGINRKQFAAGYEAFLERVHPDDRAKVDQAYTESVQSRHLLMKSSTASCWKRRPAGCGALRP
jgi:hypothetical protein